MTFKNAYFVLFLVIPIVGCVSSAKKTMGWQDVQNQLAQEVPCGTSVDKAKSRMEEFGFDCKFQTQGTVYFFESPESMSRTKLSNVDFLHCVSHIQNGLVKEVRVADLVVEDGLVAQIYFIREFVGP